MKIKALASIAVIILLLLLLIAPIIKGGGLEDREEKEGIEPNQEIERVVKNTSKFETLGSVSAVNTAMSSLMASLLGQRPDSSLANFINKFMVVMQKVMEIIGRVFEWIKDAALSLIQALGDVFGFAIDRSSFEFIDEAIGATTDTIVNVIMGPKNSLFSTLGLNSVEIETDMPIPTMTAMNNYISAANIPVGTGLSSITAIAQGSVSTSISAISCITSFLLARIGGDVGGFAFAILGAVCAMGGAILTFISPNDWGARIGAGVMGLVGAGWSFGGALYSIKCHGKWLKAASWLAFSASVGAAVLAFGGY